MRDCSVSVAMRLHSFSAPQWLEAEVLFCQSGADLKVPARGAGEAWKDLLPRSHPRKDS